MQSAALRGKGGYSGYTDRATDLRVETIIRIQLMSWNDLYNLHEERFLCQSDLSAVKVFLAKNNPTGAKLALWKEEATRKPIGN